MAQSRTEFADRPNRAESAEAGVSDMAARYAALAEVHRQCQEKLEDVTARYDDLKRVYQALVEQREQDRQQMLRYASGLVSSPRPSSPTSRIVLLTGSPKILAMYLRIMRMPGLGWFVRGLRRLALKLLSGLK